mgnify:CR=1 FL=1|jgi:hypothetical protein
MNTRPCRFAADSRVSLDVANFARNAPAKRTDASGRASWLPSAPPALVVGAASDFIVDGEGVEETAAFLGTAPVVLEGLPHDVMLCGEWEVAADTILSWVERTF